jgi:integrase
MSDLANVDLPYVETNKSRHKTVRYYLRIDGKRICRLPDDIQSEEFSKKYWEARNAALPADGQPPAAKTISSIVKPNTLRWLCMEYMKTDAFKTLDLSTQEARRRIMEAMWLEPLSLKDNRQFGDMPLAKLDHTNIEILRDRKKETPFAADERLKVLRQVFDTKKEGKAIVPNVARLVDPFNVHTDGHATATSENMAQFIEHHGLKSKAVLCIGIIMFTGFRVSDVAQLGPQHRRKDMFKMRLFKNRNRNPYDIEIAIHPILESVLALHKVTDLTYIVTEFGKPFSIKGLGNRISDWFRQAGLGHLTAHSVRKGLATDVAYNEATDSMLEAMFGWRDAKTSKVYTRNADRARLARQTVARINWDGVGTKLLAIAEQPDETEAANG